MALTVNRAHFEANDVPAMQYWLLERGAERSIDGRQLLQLVRTCARFYYTTETVWDTPDDA